MAKKNNSEFNGLETCKQLFPMETLDSFKISSKLEAIIRSNELANGLIVSTQRYFGLQMNMCEDQNNDDVTAIEVPGKNRKGEDITRNVVTNIKLKNIVEIKQYSRPHYYAYYITSKKQILVLCIDFMPVDMLGQPNQVSLAYINEARVVPTIGSNSVIDAIAKYCWIDKLIETPGIVCTTNAQSLTEFLYMTKTFPFRRISINHKNQKYTRVRIFDIENASCIDSVEFTGIFESIDSLHRKTVPENAKQDDKAFISAADFDGDPAPDFGKECPQ